MINTLTEEEDYQIQWCRDNYLTLDDLHELAKREPYKNSWDFAMSEFHSDRPTYDEKSDLYYYYNWNRGLSIVHRHMFVEEYMSRPYDTVDWKQVTNYYNLYTINDFIGIFVHPLAWVSGFQFPNDYVVLGKVAKETSNYEPYDGRMNISWDWFNRVTSEAVLYFADKGLTYYKDDINRGIKRGLHKWNYIMVRSDDEIFNHMYSNSDLGTFNEGRFFFDIDSFQKNILYIERMRSSNLAAKIIRCFQKEWDDIVLWDAFGISKYPKEQIEKFKLVLFRGYEKELEQWENAKGSKSRPEKSEPESKTQPEKDTQSFESLLQCPAKDKVRVMARLHELLDGKRGKQVALILAAAMHKYHYILSLPTEKQYTSTFQLVGTWKAVSSYIKTHTTSNGKFKEGIDHIEI